MNRRSGILGVVAFALILSCFYLVSLAVASEDPEIGVILADNHGKILYQENPNRYFIPASILKILTSLQALEIFGEQYRFTTDYYFDSQSKNLYIKGKGDPLFISESIKQFCNQIIKTYKLNRVNNIYIDQSYFEKNILVPGTSTTLNPYDANVGALCANFNTVFFKYDSAKGLISAEPQTPLLPIFHDDINASGLKKGRIVLTKEKSRIYAGHLIRYYLSKNGCSVAGTVANKKFAISRTTQIHSYASPFTMEDIVKKLLQFSNNFIANQLLLAMGAKEYGSPATISKGANLMDNYVTEKLNLKGITLSEGSGISRENRITPHQMLQILTAFKPFYTLLKQEPGHYFKTGTLSDVRTQAGYIEYNHVLFPYVIMKNKSNTGYNDILKKLKKRVKNSK